MILYKVSIGSFRFPKRWPRVKYFAFVGQNFQPPQKEQGKGEKQEGKKKKFRDVSQNSTLILNFPMCSQHSTASLTLHIYMHTYFLRESGLLFYALENINIWNILGYSVLCTLHYCSSDTIAQYLNISVALRKLELHCAFLKLIWI